MRRGRAEKVGTEPLGPKVAEFSAYGAVSYAVYDAGQWYVVRFFGACEFWVRHDGRVVVYELASDLDPGWHGRSWQARSQRCCLRCVVMR